MDNFSIKYTSLDNAQHLLHALKEKYTRSEDWEAKLYIGISLKWDYSKRTVDLSMLGHVTAAILRLFVLTSLINLWGYHEDPNSCSLRVARLLLTIDLYMRNCQRNSWCNCVRACYVIYYVTVNVPDYVTVIRVLGSGTNEGSIPRSGRGRPPSLVPTHPRRTRGASDLMPRSIP